VFAVDDDASMREALSRLFRSIGMRARSLAEPVRMAEKLGIPSAKD
jgi:FixJ family two-component response regulator